MAVVSTPVDMSEIQLKPTGEAKAAALRQELIGQLRSIPEGQGLVFELENGENIRGLKMRVTAAKKEAGDLEEITSAEDKDGNLVVFRKATRQGNRRRGGRATEELVPA